jgi:hypothetical protein
MSLLINESQFENIKINALTRQNNPCLPRISSTTVKLMEKVANTVLSAPALQYFAMQIGLHL